LILSSVQTTNNKLIILTTNFISITLQHVSNKIKSKKKNDKNLIRNTILTSFAALVIVIGISIVDSRTTVSAAKNTSPYCAPATNPTATIDSVHNAYFSNQLGPGWVGGDATYSTKLPNGKESWVFSDTLIGTATSNGVGTFTGMPHNSELVGTGANLVNDYAGPFNSPQTLIPDSNGNGNQWQVAGTYVENSKQLIFVNEFGVVAGSPFDQYTGKSGIAVMSVSGKTPSPSSVIAIPADSTTQWGNAVTSDGIYNYIYGNDSNTSTGAFYGMKLARVAIGHTTQVTSWQYWNGTKWIAGEANAVALTTGNEITGVTQQLNGSGYIGVSIPGSVYTDTSLDVSYACSPQGPWSAPTPVYTIPEITQYHDEIAYIPTFHTELSNNTSGLVVSYNIDTTDGLSALAKNVHEYQPRFLYLK
jgi:hypothetical protein